MSYPNIKVMKHLYEMTTLLSNKPGLLEVTRKLWTEWLEYSLMNIYDNAIVLD